MNGTSKMCLMSVMLHSLWSLRYRLSITYQINCQQVIKCLFLFFFPEAYLKVVLSRNNQLEKNNSISFELIVLAVIPLTLSVLRTVRPQLFPVVDQ